MSLSWGEKLVSSYPGVGDSLLEPRGPVGIDVLVDNILNVRLKLADKSSSELFPTGDQ